VRETAGIAEGQLRQEATFVAGMTSAGLHPVRARVRIPDGLADDPDRPHMIITFG